MKPYRKVLMKSFYHFNPVTLHVTEFSRFHLHSVEMICGVAPDFDNSPDSGLVYPWANVPIAISSHSNQVPQPVAYLVVNFYRHRSVIVVNHQQVIVENSLFQLHLISPPFILIYKLRRTFSPPKFSG